MALPTRPSPATPRASHIVRLAEDKFTNAKNALTRMRAEAVAGTLDAADIISNLLNGARQDIQQIEAELAVVGGAKAQALARVQYDNPTLTFGADYAGFKAAMADIRTAILNPTNGMFTAEGNLEANMYQVLPDGSIVGVELTAQQTAFLIDPIDAALAFF